MHAVTLPPGAVSIGMTLDQLHLELDGVTVQAVRRKLTGTEYTKLELKPELHLQANDILVLSGNSEALEIAEAKLI